MMFVHGIHGVRMCISESIIQDHNVLQIEWNIEFSKKIRRFG